jgi:DeoR family fructose operon transcriptional repressor
MQLADIFSVSQQTVRRDLQALHRRGLIQRTRGRAFPNLTPVYTFGTPSSLNLFIDRIGRAAAEIPNDDDIVFLGPGITTFAVAYHLGSRRGLTVITSHPQHASLLRLQGQHELWILGGKLEYSTGNILGVFAQESLQRYRSSIAIIGCDGINPSVGLVIKKADHEALARAIADSSHRLVVVADHNKFGSINSGFIIPMDRVDLIITDQNIDQDALAEVTRAGVRIKVV